MCDDLKRRRLGHFGYIIQLGSESCVNLNLCWTTKSTVSLRLHWLSAQTHPYRQSWNGPLFHLFVPENSWVRGDGMRAPCTCLNPSAPCICLEPSQNAWSRMHRKIKWKGQQPYGYRNQSQCEFDSNFFSFLSRAYLVWTQLWIENVLNIKSELYEANRDHGFNQTGWTRILRWRISLCGWFVFTSPVNMGGDNSLINHHYILKHSSFASPVLEGIIDEQENPKRQIFEEQFSLGSRWHWKFLITNIARVFPICDCPLRSFSNNFLIWNEDWELKLQMANCLTPNCWNKNSHPAKILQHRSKFGCRIWPTQNEMKLF